MILLVPLLIEVRGGWLTLVYAIAIALAFFGVTGFLFSLADLRNRPEIKDVGVGTFLFGLAGSLLIIRILTNWPYWATLILVIVLVVITLFAVIGTCMGIFKAIGGDQADARASAPGVKGRVVHNNRLNRKDYALLGVTLFLGVLTAAATIVAAFIQSAG